MKKVKNIIAKIKDFLIKIKQKLPKLPPMKPETKAKWEKAAAFGNKYSLIIHYIWACMITLIIEMFSRWSITEALEFTDVHTWAFLYNSLIIFASLSLAYLVRRRFLVRLIVSAVWLLLGFVNGCILISRVSPFGFADLKMIGDLLTMQNTNYFSAFQAFMTVVGMVAFIVFCIVFFFKGPQYKGRINRLLAFLFFASCFIWIPATTKLAQNNNIVAAYFANLAQGYENYGFIYGFSSSVVGRGMSEPDGYSKEAIEDISETLDEASEPTTLSENDMPNVVVVLLESFMDPSEIKFLECSEDPIPNFHKLQEEYTTGHMTVPIVGAGTANTEFEVLTGMGIQYFGAGEYPYKTVMKHIDNCESIASIYSKLGYGTHVVHNNGGNFYSRANAFSMMGFDSFTSKELMNITEYTELGSWPKDEILIDETIKAMDDTPNQSDLVYTITVQAHGDYPTEQVIEDPAIEVSGAETEEKNNQWEYFINQLHSVDQFLADLTEALDERDEDTLLIVWGDHLPTMGLTEEDLETGDVFKTEYATWNNFDMPKEDVDLTSYQLMAHFSDKLGIRDGNFMRLHQTQTESDSYLTDLHQLQYDVLYGKRYLYAGEDPYPATEIEMGIDETEIIRTWQSSDGRLMIYGKNFTPWSKVFVNGTKVTTSYVSGNYLRIKTDDLKDGDVLLVNQMGSSNTVFRSSNEWTYHSDAVQSVTKNKTDKENATDDIEAEDDMIKEDTSKKEDEDATQEAEPVKQYPPATAEDEHVKEEDED